MKRQTAQLRRLNPQILERLRCRINLLVNELPLYLISGQDRPPERLVQKTSNRLQDRLGEIDMSAVLDDFTVYQLGDLGGGVVLGPVQLICLRGSGVILEHFLEGFTNVDCVDGPVSLLHVVCGKDVRNTGEFV